MVALMANKIAMTLARMEFQENMKSIEEKG
jgi:hypothetical protein